MCELSRKDVTWSSIEKYYSYDKVIWKTDKSGIPRFSLVDGEGNKIV